MRIWSHILLFATLLAAFTFGGSQAASWLPDGSWGLSLYIEAAQHSDQLDHAITRSCERIRLRIELSRCLADGRLSLAEAIQRVAAHDPEEDYHTVPGQSTEERCGRALIRWVDGQLRHDAPDCVQQVVARLEKELNEYLARRRSSAPPGVAGAV